MTKWKNNAGNELDPNSHMPEGYMRAGIVPKTDAELELIADELLQWVKSDDAIRLGDYSTAKNMNPETLIIWSQRNKKLQEAYDVAKEVIASRRERKALKGEFNSTIVLRTMALYDKNYKKFLKWEASLKNKDDNKNETKVIVVDRYPVDEEEK